MSKRGICDHYDDGCNHVKLFVSMQEIREAGWRDPKEYEIIPVCFQYNDIVNCYHVRKIQTVYKINDYWLCRKHLREATFNHALESAEVMLETNQV